MRLLLVIVFVICKSVSAGAQEIIPISLTVLDSLVQENDFDQADRILKKNIHYYMDKGPLDSLYAYPEYIGKVEMMNDDKKVAEQKVMSFIKRLKNKTSKSRILYKTYLSVENFYVNIRDDQSATETAQVALDYAHVTPDITDEELGTIHYSLGSNYYSLYDDLNSVKNFKKSVSYYKKSTTVEKHKLADAYNGVAAGLWALNTLDSAEVYYKKAIDVTNESNLKGYDKAFYIASFEFNLALVIDDQGRVSDAIDIVKNNIETFQEIIANSDDEELVMESKKLIGRAIGNLAAFYNDIGYIDRAYKMAKYSYEKKKEVYKDSDPSIIIALHKIAGAEIDLRRFDKSLETIDLAFENLNKSASEYVAIEADLLYFKAKAYEGMLDTPRAKEFFDKSEARFKKAYPEQFSRRYLTMLRDYSQFLALNGIKDIAFVKAESAYNYVSKNVEEGNLTELKELQNLAEVYFIAGEYNKSLKWAQKGNQFVDDKLKKTENTLDSIQIEYRRPAFTRLEVESLYRLEDHKNVKFLKEQIHKIDKAVLDLEERLRTSFAKEDINIIVQEYRQLNTISKKLNYDLYVENRDIKILDKLLSLQESGVYYRIRTQLNAQQELSFNNVPNGILQRENRLKKSLSLDTSNDDADITKYLRKQEEWIQFIDLLKNDYPEYYKLKYASLEVPIEDLQSEIAENTTLLRYFFIDEELFVFVFSNSQKEIYKLPSQDIKPAMKKLKEDWKNADEIGKLTYELYNQLWRPIEKEITTEKVIIVPDADLFNLSFEMLTSEPTKSFKELSSKALITKHVISYCYSSLMLNENKKTKVFTKNYVGFAPEFTNKMKDEYQFEVIDSAAVDRSYLVLLPQPFIREVTDKYSQRFNGKSFLNEQASKAVFLENAKEHKIIHIGTHAESNNLYPELSRLIFAKELQLNSDATTINTNNNSLYSYEIYNANLSANLAILTACETGKPSYQAGEGMISLAHAFTYAGSESILTSLWKIDEQSSAQIVSYFYDNLKKGMHKDVALKEAKLTYLSTAQGRTLQPNYWAGLVLMGDTSSLQLTNSLSFIQWFCIGILCLALLIIFRKVYKHKTLK